MTEYFKVSSFSRFPYFPQIIKNNENQKRSWNVDKYCHIIRSGFIKFVKRELHFDSFQTCNWKIQNGWIIYLYGLQNLRNIFLCLPTDAMTRKYSTDVCCEKICELNMKTYVLESFLSKNRHCRWFSVNSKKLLKLVFLQNTFPWLLSVTEQVQIKYWWN